MPRGSRGGWGGELRRRVSVPPDNGGGGEGEHTENTEERGKEQRTAQVRALCFFFVTLMREFANQPLLRLIKKCIQPKIRLPFLSIIYNIKLSNFYIFSLLKNCKEVQLREPF